MTEKRFKIVDEQIICSYGRNGHKISNEECGFWLWHNKIESQKVCDKLNNIIDENEQLKQFKNTVFDLIDKEIKETKEIFEDGKIDLMTYNASMITLTGLKEQLKGDGE